MCPMLLGAPGHELWKRDFTGGCGLFSFVFKGGAEPHFLRVDAELPIRCPAWKRLTGRSSICCVAMAA